MKSPIGDAVRRRGHAIMPDVLKPDDLKLLHAEAMHLACGPHARRFPKSTRVFDLYRYGKPFNNLLALESLRAVATDLLGEHHLLSDYSLNVVQPGQPRDDWHIDYPYNEMPVPLSGGVLGLQCVLALDHLHQSNGATQLVPGTHQQPRTPDVDPPDDRVVTFTAQPGTMLIMAAATWHRSGHNTSHHPRAAILLSFVERWIRPMTDPPEPGPWATTETEQIMLGIRRPPETINGIAI